jgi:hypothetical protein
MIYDTSNKKEIAQLKVDILSLIDAKAIVECNKVTKKRTSNQNRSLHLYFTMISEQLNDLSLDFKYTGLKGMELSMRHTPEIVKTFIFKPIMMAMFDIESTTKINTQQINEVLDVLTNYFAGLGVVIEFPSKESLNNK